MVSGEQALFGLLVAGLGLVGLWLLYRGLSNLRSGFVIWSNDPIDAAAVRHESGVVEVQGSVKAIDGQTLSSKYTNTDCVAYDYTHKEKQHSHDPDDHGSDTEWRTVDSGSNSRPFYVTDGSGQVAVDPEGAKISLDSESVASGGGTRKSEGRLEPRDQVHVYGQKREDQEAAPGEESVYIGDGEETGRFTVSDTTEGRTVLRYVVKGAGMVVVALIFLGITGFLGNGLAQELGLMGFGLLGPLVKPGRY